DKPANRTKAAVAVIRMSAAEVATQREETKAATRLPRPRRMARPVATVSSSTGGAGMAATPPAGPASRGGFALIRGSGVGSRPKTSVWRRGRVDGLRAAVPRRPRGTGDGFSADWFVWTSKFQGFVEGRTIDPVPVGGAAANRCRGRRRGSWGSTTGTSFDRVL